MLPPIHLVQYGWLKGEFKYQVWRGPVGSMSDSLLVCCFLELETLPSLLSTSWF